MQNVFIEYVFLLLIILGLVMLANKLKIVYPIVLLVGGLLISFVPSFSNVGIDPELVFFIFLPPLLYEAAWQVSWKEFYKYRRIILSFAFPIVIITSSVVALVSTALIPGFTLALGFLLGGIISPPDAVSATTIMRQVRAPKTLVSVTEGESLLNDASSLIVFRFALAAVITGQFSIQQASLTFVTVALMGTLIGFIVGFIFYCIHRWLPVTPSIEIVLTLVTPYCMYYAAEHFHFSGVLAVVTGGLFLSSRRMTMLNYMSRIQAVNVWNSIIFVLNGMIFLLIGLQLPSIMAQLGDTSLAMALFYGVIISLVLIVARVMCTIGTSYFTRFMSHFITVAMTNPGIRMPFVYGLTGMRGVVSLAAALSIPLLINDGQPFPYRNLILFITFVVIVITLVLQGLALPWIIRKLKLEEENAIPEEEQEMIIQKKIAEHSLRFLDEKFGNDIDGNEHLQNLRSRLKIEMDFFYSDFEENTSSDNNSRNDFMKVYLDVLEHQRKLLAKMNHKSEFDEEIIRKYLAVIDMEEYRTREILHS